MGLNANFFSQLPPPPTAPQSIRFGDWVFSAPEPVTSNSLLGLGGLESPGLYVVMAYDAQWTPLPYRPLYFGESDKIWNRATPSHENYERWKREAGTATLYRAFHHMTGSSRAQRQARESALITQYSTPCGGPQAVESRPGAGADAEAPPRFPAPLIKPDVPISSIRLSD